MVGAVRNKVKSRAECSYLPDFTAFNIFFPYSIYFRAASVAASLKKEKSNVSPLVAAKMDL